MQSLIADLWNNLWLVLGSFGIGAVSSPQLQALWTKIRGTASADIAALKEQVAQLQKGTLPAGTAAADITTLEQQLAQMQSDIKTLLQAAAPKAA